MGSQMQRLKVIATKLLKDKRSQNTNGRIPKVEIKSSKKECKTSDDSECNPFSLHTRSQSQECLNEPTTSQHHFGTPTHAKKKPLAIKTWRSIHNDYRPKSTDSSLKRPQKENESLFNKLKAGLQEKARKGTPTDIGTRLFNKAQELAKKKELLKQCYTPEYSFTPKLNSDRWMTARSCKEDNPKEEVAVVSSSVGLSLKLDTRTL
eukprot:CAMPEP_0204918432 /NCGR_PEP_ID=MMETSP1397-20131031/16150_1 /ASSEMBLY_ACC=CAM_ASM_000891 /TAXON_ID=49980 /ORGANISM="Climacostomum Climacostomum virens, Strain Stock W-24" /LENGTH=205 /DNA_ID=CAMNT_0052091719 /DNA_START=171 /DNA_END=788 /DNA_ORIENTATION=+